MLTAIQTSVSAIGLVFDANEFRAIQLARSGTTDRVIASAIFPRLALGTSRPDAHELAWAESILARQGFSGNTVSILPAPEWCSSHIFELPPVEDPNAKLQLARAEVARERKCSPDSFEIGQWDLPAKGRSRESMVVSCDISKLEAALDQFEDAGIIPVSVDLPEAAIVRATPYETDTDGIVGYLHVGWGESIAVIKNNHTIVYVRRIKAGLKDVHDRLVDHVGLSGSAAAHLIERMQLGQLDESERPVLGMWTALVRSLVDGLDIAIRYVSHAYRMAELSSVFVSGYGATNDALLTEVDEVLGMPVTSLIPSVLTESGLSDAECAKLAIPTGLAMRFDH